MAFAWETLFLFDCLVAGVIFWRSWQVNREFFTPGVKFRTSLLRRVIVDGGFYFAIMASANFANILTFYLLPPVLKGCLSTLSASLSVVLMSRLMINLHECAEEGILTGTVSLTHTDEIFYSGNESQFMRGASFDLEDDDTKRRPQQFWGEGESDEGLPSYDSLGYKTNTQEERDRKMHIV
jgi:hypothetical protein